MKNFAKVAGVTLLEIMLVLAIAAMVIVMSVRYYQTASAGQQANSMLQMIQGISSAADGLAQGTGSYSSTVTSSALKSLMPNRSMISPWGTTVTVNVISPNTYSVNFPSTPAAVCSQVMARLKGNPKYNLAGTQACSSDGTATPFEYVYDSTL